uniref:Uncharacterized protein n=1 Tax=Cacopsylla melanoneura TaxID=428564 RepID=A0A8D8RSW1_9HEMI
MSWRNGHFYNNCWDERYYQNNPNPASYDQYNQRERACYDPRTKPPASYGQYNQKERACYDPRTKPLFRGRPSSNFRQGKPIVNKHFEKQQNSATKPGWKTTAQANSSVTPTKTKNQPSSTKNADNKPTSSQIKAVATPRKAGDLSTSTNKAENKPTAQTKPVLTTQKTENQPSSYKNADNIPP